MWNDHIKDVHFFTCVILEVVVVVLDDADFFILDIGI